MFLEKVPLFEHPQVKLEQYRTPAPIAADMLFIAYQHGDIADKIALDLGTGTGMFAVGAAVLGAYQVLGIDCDDTALGMARGFAHDHDLFISFLKQDISDVSISADTVLMNPPFGAQKANQHADRAFIKKAVTSAPVVYSLHLTNTIPFITKLCTALDAEIQVLQSYTMPIKSLYDFHKKMVEHFDVSLLQIYSKHGDEKSVV